MFQARTRCINPFVWAEKGHRFAQRVALADLARLRDLVLDDQGEVVVELHFSADGAGRATVEGTLKTRLILQCQRCLQGVEVDLDVDVALVMARAEQPRGSVVAGFELLLVKDEAMSVLEIIEDELILNLPIVALHPLGTCAAPAEIAAAEAEEEQRVHPFAVLETLKRNKH